ncbi:hypothetical protein KVT40_001496 [Elsinoe batatas]|uniref:Uncharacterized protein n=1 Tax=Elsinoe batatas TaxID=2601811 RepID=A0A8K0L6K2_9PEZI|nr:hypothetical protein KVT40_001496 [Elsinoe batatas]
MTHLSITWKNPPQWSPLALSPRLSELQRQKALFRASFSFHFHNRSTIYLLIGLEFQKPFDVSVTIMLTDTRSDKRGGTKPTLDMETFIPVTADSSELANVRAIARGANNNFNIACAHIAWIRGSTTSNQMYEAIIALSVAVEKKKITSKTLAEFVPTERERAAFDSLMSGGRGVMDFAYLLVANMREVLELGELEQVLDLAKKGHEEKKTSNEGEA